MPARPLVLCCLLLALAVVPAAADEAGDDASGSAQKHAALGPAEPEGLSPEPWHDAPWIVVKVLGADVAELDRACQ